jgi:S-adenosylmethionine:tRNA ribosyltransferase-isomerase
MKVSDYYFDLPENLIAQKPIDERSSSKMLCVHNDIFNDRVFSELPEILSNNDLLVLNNTKVMPSRLFGIKSTGGRVEILLERILDKDIALVQVKSNRRPKSGVLIELSNKAIIEVLTIEKDFLRVKFSEPIINILNDIGHIPLPPYIKRMPNEDDKDRYQTVFAEKLGAVAAPTAGLHFNRKLLKTILDKGIETGKITLHIGAGTFMPVREEQLKTKQLYKEHAIVSDELCIQVERTKSKGGRVVAVGTTVTRALESAALSGTIQPMRGDTNLFIYPDFEFKIVDAIITNFHLPGSSLIMLVSAFIGREKIKKAYQHAINRGYRFYSYGDAMFLEQSVSKSV